MMKRLIALILVAISLLCTAAVGETDYSALIAQVESGNFDGVMAELCALSPQFAYEYSQKMEGVALLDKYAALIEKLESNDFDSARALIDEYAAKRSGDCTCVEITGENWSEYFDVIVEEIYKVDSFGNPDAYSVRGYVVLKDEYTHRVAEEPASEVSFNVHYVDEYLEVAADFENMTREIIWSDTPVEMTNEAVLRKNTDYYGNTVYRAYFGMFGGSSIDENGNVTYGVDNFIEYEVLDAFGTLWLYKE